MNWQKERRWKRFFVEESHYGKDSSLKKAIAVHLALDGDLRLIDQRSTVFAHRPGKGFRFVNLIAADRPHTIRIIQPGLIDNVDGKFFILTDALIDVMCLHKGYHQVTVRHSSGMGDKRPSRLIIYHCPDNDDRADSGIKKVSRTTISTDLYDY